MAGTDIRAGVICAPDIRHCEILPKVSAILAGACLPVHLALVFIAGPDMLSKTVPMAGLAALCGGCAAGSWRRRCSNRELGQTVLLACVMISFHFIFMPGHADLELCSSATADLATKLLSGGSDIGNGTDFSAAAEPLMSVGVVIAGIAGLAAVGGLIHRRAAGSRFRGCARPN